MRWSGEARLQYLKRISSRVQRLIGKSRLVYPCRSRTHPKPYLSTLLDFTPDACMLNQSHISRTFQHVPHARAQLHALHYRSEDRDGIDSSVTQSVVI